MASERATVDIADSEDILRLVDDMLRTGMGVVLVRDEEPVAILDPLPASKRSSRRRRTPADLPDDSIMRLAGILDGGPPTDIARFKDEYIADAIDHRGE
jgi:hypothetical protein